MSATPAASAMTLPAAAKAAQGTGAAFADAWRGHLEKAQAAGWFCRSDALDARVSRQGRDAAACAASRRDPPIAPVLRGRAAPGAAATAVPNSAHVAEGDPGLSADGLRVPGEALAPAEPVNDGCCSDLPALARMRPEATPARTWREAIARWSPPMRQAPESALSLHVQQDSSGAQVWLGIPGQPDQVDGLAAAVLMALRRELAVAGVPLRRVVCNGMLVYASQPVEDR